MLIEKEEMIMGKSGQPPRSLKGAGPNRKAVKRLKKPDIHVWEDQNVGYGCQMELIRKLDFYLAGKQKTTRPRGKGEETSWRAGQESERN